MIAAIREPGLETHQAPLALEELYRHPHGPAHQ